MAVLVSLRKVGSEELGFISLYVSALYACVRPKTAQGSTRWGAGVRRAAGWSVLQAAAVDPPLTLAKLLVKLDGELRKERVRRLEQKVGRIRVVEARTATGGGRVKVSRRGRSAGEEKSGQAVAPGGACGGCVAPSTYLPQLWLRMSFALG